MRIIILCSLFFSFQLSAQERNEFRRLKCEGQIPTDFTSLATSLFEKDYDLNENEELDKDFFLSTRFYNDELLQSGKILFNDPLSLYITNLAKYLLKDDLELFSQLRFYVIRSNAVNAFSTDQGIVLFTTGILAHMKNEAQLAFILGHEISHYTEKHLRESYVDYKDYEKSKGRYRRLSYYDAINTMSKYDQMQELDADKKGLEIYLKSDYDPAEIENAFISLHYGYLPFEDLKFDLEFLQTQHLKLPINLLPDTIRQINPDLNYDDSGSTHPNIEKRINSTNEFLVTSNNSDKKKYIVFDESEFKKLQTSARFESVNIDLADRFYGDALYQIFLLDKEFPNNSFLDISKVKALYGLAKYKNHNRFEEVTSRLKYVEGESYKLHYLLRNLTRQQLNVLTFRHLYDMHIKYPNDSEFTEYYEDFKKEFALNSMINFEQLKSTPLANEIVEEDTLLAFNIKDSIVKIEMSNLSKLEKAKLKKELLELIKTQKEENPETNFHLYGLHDLVSIDGFVAELKALNQTLNEEILINKSIQTTNAENIKTMGYRLGIKEIMVVDPLYENYNLKVDKNYIKSEKRRVEICETYTKKFRRLDVNTQILDSKSLTSSDVIKYNEIAIIKDWMSEVLDHDGIEMISSSHDQMAEINQKYNTTNYLFSGVYGFKERKHLSRTHLIGIGMIYPIPFILIDILLIHNHFEMVSFVIDSEDDKIEMLDVQEVNLNSMSKIIRSYIFNVMYQISSEA